MLVPIHEKVPNPKFGVVISKTVACRFWTRLHTRLHTYKHTNLHGATEDDTARDEGSRREEGTGRWGIGENRQKWERSVDFHTKSLRDLNNII